MADPKKPGINWNALMQLVAPIVGEVSSGGDRGAFLSGYEKAQQRAEEKKQQDAQIAQRTAASGANYLMDVTQHAQGITDPIDFQNFVDMAQQAGEPAGYVKPGQLRSTLKFSNAKQAEAQLKELTDQLDQLEKGGYDLDQLASAGSSLHLKSGKTIPIGTAMEMTRQRPTDATGAAIPKPKKADTAASTDYGRFLSKWAKDRGKTVDQISAKDELSAKDEFAQAGRAPSDPTGSIEALRQLALNKPPPTGPRERFNVQPITNQDGTTGLVRINMDTGETSAVDLPKGAGSGRASDTQRLSKAYMDRTTASDVSAKEFEKGLTGLGPQFNVQLPNLLRSEAGQRYRQAKDEFINAALRRESGAAIQPSEYERFDKIYFVQPGDTPATIQQKQTARARVTAGFKVAAGNLSGGAEPANRVYYDANGKPVKP